MFLLDCPREHFRLAYCASDALQMRPAGDYAARIPWPIQWLQGDILHESHHCDLRFGNVLQHDRISDLQLTFAFGVFALVWKKETSHLSVLRRRYEHYAYKAILAMRAAAIPLILEDLRRDPDYWFEALEDLTGQNPAEQAQTFYEAIDEWIAWGIANDYIRERTAEPVS